MLSGVKPDPTPYFFAKLEGFFFENIYSPSQPNPTEINALLLQQVWEPGTFCAANDSKHPNQKKCQTKLAHYLPVTAQIRAKSFQPVALGKGEAFRDAI